jgi:hypothetical protein
MSNSNEFRNIQCVALIIQYPFSPVTANLSSETFICGARSCSARRTTLALKGLYNQPGIGLPAQSLLSSNS